MFGRHQNPAFFFPLTMTAKPVRRRGAAALLRAAQSSGAALMQVARAIADRIERRDQTRILAALDDRMLADIGLTRGEIPFRVRDAMREAPHR
jgi:uncharacterized protein YjiS (DUF1127 family)